jgi:hypothetical protein
MVKDRPMTLVAQMSRIVSIILKTLDPNAPTVREHCKTVQTITSVLLDELLQLGCVGCASRADGHEVGLPHV